MKRAASWNRISPAIRRNSIAISRTPRKRWPKRSRSWWKCSGQKLLVFIKKYAKDNGYTLVLDVGNPNTPVLYNETTYDVTADMVAAYDKTVATAALVAPPPRSMAAHLAGRTQPQVRRPLKGEREGRSPPVRRVDQI